MIGPAHHMAIGRANAHELVKREYDSGVRQFAPCERDKIDPEREEVMEMNHIGPYGVKEIDVHVHEAWRRRFMPPIIVVLHQEQVFIVTPIKTSDARTGLE